MHFWSLHFGPILNLVPKLISLLSQSLFSKIVFILVPTINLVTEKIEVTNGGPKCQTQLLIKNPTCLTYTHVTLPPHFPAYLALICPCSSTSFSHPLDRHSKNPKSLIDNNFASLTYQNHIEEMKSSSSSSASLKRKASRKCYCPSLSKPILVVSWTENNPGRRFYGCPNY